MAAFINYDLAREVAQEVYRDGAKPWPDGWELDTTLIDSNHGTVGYIDLPNGFYAYALKPIASNHNVAASTRILAFRGTEMSKATDLYADTSDIGQKQFDTAKPEIDRWLRDNVIANNNIELVGHSLGGALVQWAINIDNLDELKKQIGDAVKDKGIASPDPLPHLHFYTFNAPGITYTPGGNAANRTSPVAGEHHVIAYQLSQGSLHFVGDPIHLLGGPQVGGKVVGHNADFSGSPSSASTHFAHSIKNDAGWWDAPVTAGYKPLLMIDAQASQAYAKAVTALLGADGQPANDQEAALKLGLILNLTAARKLSAASPLAALLISVDASLPVLMDKLLIGGSDGLKAGLGYLLDLAKRSGQNVAEFAVKLTSAVYDSAANQLQLTGASLASVANELGAFLTDTAKGIANAWADFTKKFSDATFSLGASPDLAQYKTLEAAFAPTGTGSIQGAADGMLDAIHEAGQIVAAAGESIAILPGAGANPFDTAGFDPNLLTVGMANLEQWQVKTFTLYLPYAAGDSGQKVHLQLNGSAASSFAFLDAEHDRAPFNADGSIDVTVEAGSRQATFSLLVAKEVGAAATLGLSATLEDASGQPTHATHLAVNLNVAATEEAPANPAFANLTPIAGKPAQRFVNGVLFDYTDYQGDDNGDLVTAGDGPNNIHAGNGNNSIQGGAGNDSIYSGSGSSVIHGGGGRDWISSDGDGNNLVTADGGQDIIFPGGGNNRIYANGVVDVETALEQAAQAAASGARGNFIALGDGDNTVVGGTGNDAILMGNGDNLIVCGPGDTTVQGGVIGIGAQEDWSVQLVKEEGNHYFLQPSATQIASAGGYAGAGDYDGVTDGAGKPVGMGNATIFGGSGNAALFLSNGDNYVDLGSGNSSVFGGMGSDTLFGGSGNVLINAGGGDDYIDAESGNDTIWGGLGNNTIYGGSGHSTIFAGKGGQGRDWATANGGNNYVEAGTGDTVIYGSGGNDTLVAGSGNDTIYAGDGKTTILGGDGAGQFWGGAGTDVIYAGDGGSANAPTQVAAGSGDTTVYGGAGIDWIQGGSGRNVLYAGDGGTADAPTKVVAGSGDTTVYGGAGIDHIYGGAGKNVLYAGDGGTVAAPTIIVAGSGDTTVYGGNGVDHIYGGAGKNVLYAGDGGGADGRTVVMAGDGDTTVFGGNGADLIVGGAGADLLYAGDGGTPDNPTQVSAGTGSDTLVGGNGYSILVGGPEPATYVIGGDAGTTVITRLAAGDVLQFGDDVAPSDIAATAQAYADGTSALVLDVGGATVTIMGGLADSGARFRFAGGDMRLADLLRQAEVTPQDMAGNGTELVFGAADGAVLAANRDHATVYGFGRNDTLSGGIGSSTLVGGGGDATYFVSGQEAAVSIQHSAAGDVLQFGAGVRLEEVSATLAEAPDGSRTATIRLAAGGSVVIEGAGPDALNRLRFADGGSVTLGDLVEMTIAGQVIPAGTTTTVNPDGSSVVTVSDGHGNVTSTMYNAQGAKTGITWTNADRSSGGEAYRDDGSFTRTVKNGHGMTVVSQYDAHGALTGDTWTKPDSAGTDTYNLDGSSFGTANNADGTASRYVNDGKGNLLTDYYNAQGTKTGDAWSKPDGSHGTDLFMADGSSSGEIHQADGTYSTYVNDGQGNTDVVQFDALGRQIGESGTLAHGPSRVDDGHGNVTVTYYDGHGTRISDTWMKADGSHGSDSFNSDGSSSGVRYQASGDYSLVTDDGLGKTITKSYSWNGILLGSSVTEEQGLHNVITSFSNAGGVKVREIWTRGDGSSGADPVTGLSLYGTQFFKVGGGGYWPGDSSTRADYWCGNYGEVSSKVFYGKLWMPNGYIANSKDDLSLSYASIKSSIADFWLIDDLTDVQWHGFEDANGRKLIYGEAGGEPRIKGGVADVSQFAAMPQTPLKMTQKGNNGTYSTLSDDGQGNILMVSYSASSTKLGDMWIHNDGTFGGDIFNADGSRSGASFTAGISFLRYTDDGKGNVQIQLSSAPLKTNNVTPQITLSSSPLSWVKAPDSSARLGQQYAADASGPLAGFAVSSPDNQGGSYIALFRTDGSVNLAHVDAQGQELSGGFVDTDPGYGTSTLVSGKKYGWNYDVNGRPVSSYSDDGHGSVVTYYYDSEGRTTGRSESLTDDQGIVMTLSFDAAGNSTGSSTKQQIAPGQFKTTTYDKGGKLTGSSLIVSDGAGNFTISNDDANGALVTASTTVVTGPSEVTTTSYDARGHATGAIVTSTEANGTIHTANYDAGGRLVSSVVATPDGAGNVNTENYDASGVLTGSVKFESDPFGAQSISVYNASGMLIRSNVLHADGTSTAKVYTSDGAWITTTRAVDRGYQVSVNDGLGNVTTTAYDTADRKLGDTWTRVDGSSGSDTYNPDGTSTGNVSYADGTSSSYTRDAQGEVHTRHVGADGKTLLGSSVSSESNGDAVTVNYDANGARIGDLWTHADGTWGSDSYHADGSSKSTSGKPDGSTVVTENDGKGSVASTQFDKNGAKLGDNWSRPDGSHGSDLFGADGSTTNMIFAPDGTSTTTVNDGKGNTIATRFDKNGLKLSDAWSKADGSHGDDLFAPDGSSTGTVFNRDGTYASVANDGKGDVVTTQFDKNGIKTSDSWTKADGSHGSDTFNADGSSSGRGLNPDGSYSTYSGSTDGWISGMEFDKNGAEIGQFWRGPDGYHEHLTYYPDGSFYDSWEGSDGSFGTRTRQADGSGAQDWTEADGTKYHEMTNPDGSRFDTWSSPNGSHGTDEFAADWTGFGTAFNANGSYSTYTYDGHGNTKTIFYNKYGVETGITWDYDNGTQVSETYPDQAPVLNHPIADQTVDTGKALQYAVPADTFTDPNVGDRLSLSATLEDGSALPSWLSFDAAAGAFSGTPGKADAGVLNIRVAATDTSGLSAATPFSLTVNNANEAPVAGGAIPVQVTDEGKPFNYVIPATAFSDPDAGDTLSYAVTLSDGQKLPAWLTFDPATRTLHGTPGDADTGAWDMKATATDTGGLSASTHFNIVVNEADEAPKAAAQAVTLGVTAGQAFSLSLSDGAFSDPDAGDALTYTVASTSTLPAWLHFDPGTATLSGTPGTADTGFQVLSVVATDSGGLSASEILMLAVNKASDMPLAGTAGADRLAGQAGNELLQGLDGDDRLTGNAGNDTLDGGAGADTMMGGTGNDVYIVDNLSDAVIENADEGSDRVKASISYVLPANVENLTMTGTGNLIGTGNAFDNVIAGNAGKDTLIGGGGNDTLIAGLGVSTLVGGSGNDTFIVNNSNDVILSDAGAGSDVVLSCVDYVLPANVQTLMLTGKANLTAAANGGTSLLVANSGNDTLIGGSGIAVLEGRDGMDTLNGTNGAGVLLGGAGNDTIAAGTANAFVAGETGDDAITLGAGAHVLAFNNGDGKDVIVSGNGGDNVLSLGGGIDAIDLLFGKSGDDLVLYNGSSDSITFKQWYAADSNHGFVALQVLGQANAGYNPGSGDALDDKKVEEFDFGKLVAQFDQARLAAPAISSWSLMNSLLDAHLTAGDTAALGGDLAFYYGTQGNLSGMNIASATGAVQDAQFGRTAQKIDSWNAISHGIGTLV